MRIGRKYRAGDIVGFKRKGALKILKIADAYCCDDECKQSDETAGACENCDGHFYNGILLADINEKKVGTRANLAGCFTKKLTPEELLYYSF